MGQTVFGIRNGFTPRSISGLKLDLNAAIGITLASTKVSTWADQSGNGNDVTQATDANRPTFNATGFNGKACVTFGALTTTALVNTTANLVASGTARDVFIVAAPTSIAAVQGALAFRLGGNTFECLAAGSLAGVTYYFSDGVNAYNVQQPEYKSGVTKFEWNAAAFGPAVPVNYLADKVQYGDVGSNFFSRSDTGTTGFIIGNRANLLQPFIGDIARVLVYDSVLSAGNRAAVMTYLANQYPSSHLIWVGDSILEGLGQNESCGWRRPAWDLGQGSLPFWAHGADNAGSPFVDPFHDGVPGAKIEDLTTELENSMDVYAPDICLLQAMTNNTPVNDAATILALLSTQIDNAFAHNASKSWFQVVQLNGLKRTDSVPDNTVLQAVNAGMAAMIAANTHHANVTLVDIYDSLPNPALYYIDGLHPSTAGDLVLGPIVYNNGILPAMQRARLLGAP